MEQAEALMLSPLTAGWRWVLAGGLAMVAAGLGALAAPVSATATISVAIGWLLVLAGLAGIVAALRTRGRPLRAGGLLAAAAAIMVGVFVLFHPRDGARTLTLALALWLVLRGIADLRHAARRPPGRRLGLAAVGTVDLLLAVALVAAFPMPAVRAVGIALAAGLVIAGLVSIATALRLREIR